MLHLLKRLSLVITVMASLASPSVAGDRSILLQSTTSTANSGLYDHLLPQFESSTGIKVNVVAVGTGQAIRNARNCDATVLLVHAKDAELSFVEQGFGVERFDVMYNDFIVVGPDGDPAAIQNSSSVIKALSLIADSGSLFASRGDDSGTHQKELKLWKEAGIDPTVHSGLWYRETGSGMGTTLNTGIGMQAYVMTDRATWVSFKNKQNYRILVEGDESLFNQYGVILVSPDKCPQTDVTSGQALIDWLLSEQGQRAIADYHREGEQLFYPNAVPSGVD